MIPLKKEQPTFTVDAKKIILSSDQLEFLIFAINSSQSIVDEWYPVISPVFDEDAGVHTDYGKNQMQTIWANNFFNSGIQIIHLALQKKIWMLNEKNVCITIPDFCIPFATAILIGAAENQEKLIEHQLHLEYESDGHYTWFSKSDFIAHELLARRKPYKFIKTIIEIFESSQ